MIQNALKNWRTTAAGVLTVSTSLTHLGFLIYHKTVTEGDVTFALSQSLIGLGLIVAGDASHSEAQIKDVKDAVISGNTDILTKQETKPKEQA